MVWGETQVSFGVTGEGAPEESQPQVIESISQYALFIIQGEPASPLAIAAMFFDSWHFRG